MRLSLACLFKKTVNGHIFRGKNRLVKPVSKRAMERLRTEYDLMEQNMLYLRHPYLSIEESSGHTKELGKTEAKMAKWRDYNLELKRKPNITIEERLACLKIKEAWD
uniref:Putative ribosomal protein 63 mitochondrial n=1 Tax=Phlebotomus kandelakii TaxID=1109342 RepID=A0A6B2EFF0_9DIPT